MSLSYVSPGNLLSRLHWLQVSLKACQSQRHSQLALTPALSILYSAPSQRSKRKYPTHFLVQERVSLCHSRPTTTPFPAPPDQKERNNTVVEEQCFLGKFNSHLILTINLATGAPFFIPISWIRKLRPREVKSFAKGNTVHKGFLRQIQGCLPSSHVIYSTSSSG